MRRALALAALAALVLAVPAAAQTGGSADCVGPNPSMAEQNRRALEERHRGFLSRIYALSTVGIGPDVGGDALMRAATFEGGYQFDSGDAVAFVTSARAALLRDPVFGELNPESASAVSGGVQYVVGLGRFAPRSAVARRAELGLGLAGTDYGGGGVVTAEVHPRVVVPVSSFLSVPVGLQISQPVGGGYEGARTFVGLSVGLRSQYTPANRLVLDCGGFSGSTVPQR